MPAHIIRRQATTFYKACFDLTAVSRWCLTGTPIQNRLDDVGTLFAFIRARPFHSLATFRQYIANPYLEGGPRRELACQRLISLLDSLCLRRTTELLHLPNCNYKLVCVDLTIEERTQYGNIKRIMERIIRQRGGVYELDNKFGMFQANMQLRIFCNHGTFQRDFSWNRRSHRDEREAAISAVGQSGEMVCSACKLPMPVIGSNRIYKMFVEECRHILCSECLEDSSGIIDEAGRRHCPLCVRTGTAKRLDLPSKDTSEEEDDDLYFQPQGYSSKMQALMKDVQHDLWSTKR